MHVLRGAVFRAALLAALIQVVFLSAFPVSAGPGDVSRRSAVVEAVDAVSDAVVNISSEYTAAEHVNPFAGGKRKVGSIGVPISDTDCRIVDLKDGNTDVPVESPGELLVRGPQVMKGYRHMPERSTGVDVF